MLSNLPWEALLDNASFNILFTALFYGAAGFFYLYRLDKIPALGIPGVMVVFLLTRVVDIATFFWASGGEYAADETNLAYQIATALMSHFWAMTLIQVGATVMLGVAFWLLWIGRVPRRLWLAVIATFSAMGLAGAIANALYFFGLW